MCKQDDMATLRSGVDARMSCRTIERSDPELARMFVCTKNASTNRKTKEGDNLSGYVRPELSNTHRSTFFIAELQAAALN